MSLIPDAPKQTLATNREEQLLIFLKQLFQENQQLLERTKQGADPWAWAWLDHRKVATYGCCGSLWLA
jgi:hypothetical protein